jgi:cell division protein FtsL
MMRLLNIMVLAALVSAAAYVYSIKYEAARHAGQVAKLQLEIKQEREAIAELKAQWAQLNSPDRLQALAEKHLRLRPLAINQLHDLAGLPDKPVIDPDPIGSMLEALGSGADPLTTGSVPGMPLPQRRPAGGR